MWIARTTRKRRNGDAGDDDNDDAGDDEDDDDDRKVNSENIVENVENEKWNRNDENNKGGSARLMAGGSLQSWNCFEFLITDFSFLFASIR